MGFLLRFNAKYGDKVPIPEFFTDTWDETVKECQRLQQPMFFYLHDDTNEDCSITDTCVIGSEVIHSYLTGKFLCYGLNVNTNEGQWIKITLGASKPPYIALISFKWSRDPQVIAHKEGNEITLESVSEMFELSSHAFDEFSTPIQNPPWFPSHQHMQDIPGVNRHLPAYSAEEQKKMQMER